MIAQLPHDLQRRVWDLYTRGLRERYAARARRAIDSLLAQMDPPWREYLLDWMAHMLHFPHAKPHRALVLIGEERGGIDVLLALLSRLVPTLHTREPRRDLFARHGHFRHHLEMARLIVLDNPTRLNTHIGWLKSLLRDREHLIRWPRAGFTVMQSNHRIMLLLSEARAAELSSVSLAEHTFVNIHCSGGTGAVHEALADTAALDALRQLLMSRPNAIFAHSDTESMVGCPGSESAPTDSSLSTSRRCGSYACTQMRIRVRLRVKRPHGGVAAFARQSSSIS